jgi:heptosyltransferase II
MKRILIIQTAFLGDVILATALAETLHHARPETHIHMLVNKKNASLLNNHPYIKEVLLFDKEAGRIRELFRLLKHIRRNRYEAVVNVHRFFSSGFLTAFSKAPIRSGFSKNPLSFMFTHTSKHEMNNLHETKRNSQLISFAGVKDSLRPRLYLSTEDEQITAPYKQVPYICVAPASVWFTKQFPVEKWVDFLNLLPSNIPVYLLGSDHDQQICNLIEQQTTHRKTIILCGKLSLLQTASLMKDALMNYVNDSAPLHITSALDAPVTAVFCSTVPSFGFGPLSNDAFIAEINGKLSCRPCGIHGLKSCPQKHFKCAYDIDNQILLARTTQKLTNTYDNN